MSFNKNTFDFGNPITPKINNKIIPIFTLKREIKTAQAVFFVAYFYGNSNKKFFRIYMNHFCKFKRDFHKKLKRDKLVKENTWKNIYIKFTKTPQNL